MRTIAANTDRRRTMLTDKKFLKITEPGIISRYLGRKNNNKKIFKCLC